MEQKVGSTNLTTHNWTASFPVAPSQTGIPGCSNLVLFLLTMLAQLPIIFFFFFHNYLSKS